MGEKVQIMVGVTIALKPYRVRDNRTQPRLSELVIVGILGAVLPAVSRKELEIENEQVPVYQIDVTAYRDDVLRSVKSASLMIYRSRESA